MTSKLIPKNPEKVMVIRKITPDIVTLSSPFARFGLMQVGGRGTIVRLQSGSLAVFSPVALTPSVKETVTSLGGPIRYIIAPDVEHHVFLTPWKQEYPEAQIIAPEGLREKREKNPETAGLDFAHVFTKANKRELKISEEFDGEFDHEYLESHANQELVFNHRPTKSLIQADLLFNLPATEQYSKSDVSPTQGAFTKLFNWLMNTRAPAKPQKYFLWYAASSKDRKAFADSVNHIYKWDFDRIIPCHGDVIETGGRDTFRRMFDWFLDGENKKKI